MVAFLSLHTALPRYGAGHRPQVVLLVLQGSCVCGFPAVSVPVEAPAHGVRARRWSMSSIAQYSMGLASGVWGMGLRNKPLHPAGCQYSGCAGPS